MSRPGGRVWVLGAAGMLGRTLVEELAAAGWPLLATGREVDVASRDQLAEFAAAERRRAPIAWVVNCAAMTQVDACEERWREALAVNGLGAGHVGEVAAALKAGVLHVSTDYVFDPGADGGGGGEPLAEHSHCQPRSCYGRSKWVGEALFANAAAAGAPWWAVVRTSWLFGEHGANFVATMLAKMKDESRLQVVADQTGRPTYARDLARALIALLGGGGRPPAPVGLYHFANAGATSWHGFAAGIWQAAHAAGLPLRVAGPDAIEPVPASRFPRAAPRPGYSVLHTGRIAQVMGEPPRPWGEALAAYLARRASAA